MKKKPYGCLTLPGLAAGLLTVLVIAVIGILHGGTLFSPGSLNAESGSLIGAVTSHAEVGGRCSACHAFFWQSYNMADRCVTCHADVATQLNDPTSLHGSQYQKNPNLTCRICHPDHRGASASLTDMSKVNISHDMFGYSLNAHPQQVDGTLFACKTCHVTGYTTFDQMICAGCHQQINADFMPSHLEAYGQNCLACHDGIDTYGHDFNHDIVAFQLVGKHDQLDCGECHAGARNIADLKATPQDCNSCHAKDDAHRGEFGTGCVDCHTPNGWLPASFDHSLTQFPLTGAHTQINCTQCHTTQAFTALSTACSSCHTDPAVHAGLFHQMTCDQCHTTAIWNPSTFDHSLTRFTLTGAHVQLACTQCHAPAGDIISATCAACHDEPDIHAGLFTDMTCEQCHTTISWSPATFDHSSTLFPLTGAHSSLACTSCHIAGEIPRISSSCASCHPEPSYHAGLFAGISCDQCHRTSAWIPASFNLNHPAQCEEENCINHEGASCRDCHPTNLSTATCLKCHSSNNPGDGGDDD